MIEMNDFISCHTCKWSGLTYNKFPCSNCRNHHYWLLREETLKTSMNEIYGLSAANLKNIPTYSLEIEKVIFNDPATIVIWKSGAKTVVKCQPEDNYDPEKGLALCFMKRALGNEGNYNDIFRKWLPKKGEQV